MCAAKTNLAKLRTLVDFQCSSTLKAVASSPDEQVPNSYQQQRLHLPDKRKADDPIGVPSPAKRRTTPSTPTLPRMSLRVRLLECLEVNSVLYIHEIAQLSNTLAFVLRKYYSKNNDPIDARNVNVILVQDEEPGLLPFWPRRGYSLHVVIGTKVAVRGQLSETRKGALPGLRNAVERMAAGP